MNIAEGRRSAERPRSCRSPPVLLAKGTIARVYRRFTAGQCVLAVRALVPLRLRGHRKLVPSAVEAFALTPASRPVALASRMRAVPRDVRGSLPDSAPIPDPGVSAGERAAEKRRSARYSRAFEDPVRVPGTEALNVRLRFGAVTGLRDFPESELRTTAMRMGAMMPELPPGPLHSASTAAVLTSLRGLVPAPRGNGGL